MRSLALLPLGLLAACSAGGSQAGLCRPPQCAPAESSYAIEVSAPAHSMGLGPIDLADVRFDTDTGGLTMTLPKLVNLSGTVTLAGKALAGTAVAIRPARIVGRPDLTIQAAINPMGRYTLMVPPTVGAEVYEVRFVPSNASITEIAPESLSVAVQTDMTLDFKLSATKQLFVGGTILDVLGMPVKGMQVQALDPTSGHVISTTLNSLSDGGYNLGLSTTWKGTVARLVATPTLDAPAGTPTLTQQITIGPTSATNVNLSIPALPTVAHFSYRVLGISTSGAETAVVGAHCQFVATVSLATNTRMNSLSALYQQSAVTDGDGSLTVDLIPSDASAGNRIYNVTVSPPSNSDFASQKLQIAVGPTGGYGAPVMLAVRPAASGRVIDQRGLPIAGVTVQPGLATVAQLGFASSLADLSKLTTTASETDGRFSLRLDLGQYDLAFIPPASKLLPRHWMNLGPLTSDTDLHDVVLPPGVIVRTQVVDSDGDAVQGAGIQLFIVPAPSCGGEDPACARTPRVLVDTATSSDGSAQMLLPTQ